MPQVGGFLLGAAGFGAGALTVGSVAFGGWVAGAGFASTLAFKLLSSVALSALSQALAPKPKTPGIKSEQTLQGETTPAGFVLGYYATNGSFPCPDMSHGKVGKTPNAYLTRIYHLSDVPGMALSALILDGERVTIGGGTDHPDYGQNISGRFNGYAWIKYYNGSQTAADPMLLAQYGSYPTRPWSADMIGRGLCYAILTFRRAPDIFNAFPVVRFEVSGIPLYDPRLDTTVGGSGAHRWANAATWTASNNPMVQAYNILRGIALQDGTVWGGKYTAADLPLAEWFAAMNACDASVAIAGGGTEARYRSGFEVALTDEPASVLEELLKACNAVLADVGGVVKPRVGGPALPVFFISDDDLIVSEAQDYNPAPGLADTYNAITASHPSPANSWEATAAPPRYYPAYEAQDGDRRLVADLSLPAVPYTRQVQRLMYGYIADERRFRRHNITLPPKAGVLEPMVDSIAWTSEVNGYSAKVFEVSEITDDLMTGLQRLAIRERDPSDYDWSAVNELPTSPVPGGFVPPPSQSVPSWAVTATTISDGTTDRRPALRLSWDGTDLDDVRALEWQVRRVGTATVVQSGSTHLVETGALIVADGILPAVSYEARARLKVNRARAWTSWAAATTADIRLGAAEIDASITGDIADALANAATAQAAADAAMDAAIVADSVADGVRSDHDALVAGFQGTLTDAMRAGLRGWVADPIFAQWSAGNLVAANWALRTGVSDFAVQFAGEYGGGMHVTVPIGSDSVTVAASMDSGLVQATAAEWVVISLHLEYFNGHVGGAAFRAEWSPDGTTWTRGTVGGVTTIVGTFSQLGISPAAGVLQVREVLVRRPAGSFSHVRAVLLPKLPGVTNAQQMKIHLMNIRQATQTEIEAGQTYTLATASPGVTTTVSGIGAAIAQVNTALTGQVGDVSARVDDVIGLSVTPGTAFATLMTQLAVDAGGTSATVTAQGVAISDLEGNASASYLFRAVAGSGSSLLELVAADDPIGGSVSIARISADNILLDGTVGARELVLTEFSGNLIANGHFAQGDFRGWSSIGSTFTLVARDTGSSTVPVANAPRPWILRMAQDATNKTAVIQEITGIEAGQILNVSWKHAGSATPSVTTAVILGWYDAGGALISNSVISATTTSGTWATATGSGTAPALTAKCIVTFRRTGGGTGVGWATDIEVLRARAGSTFITPNSVTTGLVAADTWISWSTALFGGIAASSDYVPGVSGWAIDNDGDAEFNSLAVRTSMIVNGAVITEKIGDNAVSTLEYANTAGSISVATGPSSFVTVQTLTITKARAQPVLLDAQCLLLKTGTDTGTIYARVMRGATILRLVSFTYNDGWNGGDAESSSQYRLMLPVVDSSTASGSVTYTLEVGTTMGGTTATARFIGNLNTVK